MFVWQKQDFILLKLIPFLHCRFFWRFQKQYYLQNVIFPDDWSKLLEGQIDFSLQKCFLLTACLREVQTLKNFIPVQQHAGITILHFSSR